MSSAASAVANSGAVATRYDKLGSRYAATCTIAAIMDWTRARPDQKSPDTT